jgi:hypothetical protein
VQISAQADHEEVFEERHQANESRIVLMNKHLAALSSCNWDEKRKYDDVDIINADLWAGCSEK